MIYWLWAWCRFRFLLFIRFVDIHSDNVVSDGLLFTECNYHWFLCKNFFKVDVIYNMLMIFFSKDLGYIFQCWMPGCNHCSLAVFFVFFFLNFVVGVRHGFLLTCLWQAFSDWNCCNLVLWKIWNMHYYFSSCNQMYWNIYCGEVAIVTLKCFWSYVEGDKILV